MLAIVDVWIFPSCQRIIANWEEIICELLQLGTCITFFTPIIEIRDGL